MYTIGIDVGGTFTDLVAVDQNGVVTLTKVPSTPADPSEGVLNGLGALATALGLELKLLLTKAERIVHGTTVATNALLERRGAKLALMTTKGHRDVLAMREGLKEDRYNLRLAAPQALVPRHLTFGVEERSRFDGTVETPLNESSLEAALEQIQAEDIEAIAVCYLHSYRAPSHEQATATFLRRALPGIYLSISVDVLPQIKEYERICTTVANAYVGPVLAGYLTRLESRLQDAGLKNSVLIMQSHGGVASIPDSIRLAAGSVLSGPAGGIAGAGYCGRLIEEGNLITFDMGGTSTDIALIERGEPQLSANKTVAGALVALPTIDIHTLGAGGGSIARVDAGGLLHVGPESAGSVPGPACYGRGGTLATVTDANLVLGYLDPENFLGGRSRLLYDKAAAVVSDVARQIGGTLVEAADGICRLVNTAMAEGISAVSVRRGVDPRRFTLLAFGGAAGLHVAQVARILDIGRVVVPRIASVLSAWGMLAGDLRWELVQSCVCPADVSGEKIIRDAFAEMERNGRAQIAGGFAGELLLKPSLDMRFGDQIFETTISLEALDFDGAGLMDRIRERFHRRHEELYGYSSPTHEVLIVNARLAVVGILPSLPQEPLVEHKGEFGPTGARRMYVSQWQEIPVYNFDHVVPGAQVVGPAVFESPTTTVLVGKDDRVSVTRHGWLDIEIARQKLGLPAL